MLVYGGAYFPVCYCLLGYVDPVGEVQALPSAVPTTPELSLQAGAAADVRHITRILSHPQAFGQCETFLSRYVKGIECQEVSSTSKAAQIAAENASKITAAISNSLAAEALGLSHLACVLQDREDNMTRFSILRKRPSPDSHMISLKQPVKELGSLKWKTMASFDIDHGVSGALADALSVFKTFGLNLSSISSRPSRLQLWHYRFLLEFEEERKGMMRAQGTIPLQS